MSGPKVVRVVTRQEMEAICARLIAVAQAAAADLVRTLKRHGLLTDAIRADIDGRLEAISGQLQAGQFSALQKQVPTIAAFLRAEMLRYQQIAIANAEKARVQRQQVIDAADTVTQAIERQGKSVPSELAQVASRAKTATIDDLAGMRSVIDQAFRTLVVAHPDVAPVTSKDLAAKLSEGLTQQSLASWVSAQPKASALSERLNKLLAEVEVLGDTELLAMFSERATNVDRVARAEQRRLLIDSLILDVAAKVNQLRQAQAERQLLMDVDAELSTIAGNEARALSAKIATALGSSDLAGAPDLAQAGRSLIEVASAQSAAASRRRAVLQGLAGLGYEVREGMETAWAQDGRLVVAKPGATDYGVELGGPGDASRLQMRVVGAEDPVSPRSQQRDTDQESLWCTDVGELLSSLSKIGTEITIERALPVGAQPLKTTTSLGKRARDADEVEVRTAITRTIK